MKDKITRLEWIEALESGEHRQVTGILVAPNGSTTCCLGVAGKLCGYERKKDTCFEMINEVGVEINSLTVNDLFDPPLDSAENIMAQKLNDIQRADFPTIAAEFRKRWNLPKEEA